MSDDDQIRSILNKRSYDESLTDDDYVKMELNKRYRAKIENERNRAVLEAENAYQTKLEMQRVKEIMEAIVQMPPGMNGFNHKTKRFIRWLPGYNGPVSRSVAEITKIPTNWFVDSTLQVYLHWNTDGYYEMRSKDSVRFIYAYNLCTVFNLPKDELVVAKTAKSLRSR